MKLNTLNKSIEFKTVLSTGKKFHTSNFNLFFLEADETRYGFVASKRVFSRAVDRNKAKRAIRRYVQSNRLHTDFPELSSGHYIFILKINILSSEF